MIYFAYFSYQITVMLSFRFVDVPPVLNRNHMLKQSGVNKILQSRLNVCTVKPLD